MLVDGVFWTRWFWFLIVGYLGGFFRCFYFEKVVDVGSFSEDECIWFRITFLY